jgi:type II secretory pathway pseudopilin PulG
MTHEQRALRSMNQAIRAYVRAGRHPRLLRGWLLTLPVDQRVPESIRRRVIDRLAPAGPTPSWPGWTRASLSPSSRRAG